MDPARTFRRLVPVAKLAPWITPTDDVYVIAHMGIARVDVADWRLTVDGLVERRLELDYREVNTKAALVSRP
jgi:DMSO/TMAO reductase YedYZ molybdopterin-dependent catalytic subunit